MAGTKLTGRCDINLTGNLTSSTEIAWSIFPRLVTPGARLDGRGQIKAIEEISGRQGGLLDLLEAVLVVVVHLKHLKLRLH